MYWGQDGPLTPLWERLLGNGDERSLGEAKQLELPYGFALSYPVSVLEYLLCSWYGSVLPVGQSGGTRSHHLADITFAHAARLILDWPLYQLGRHRLTRALLRFMRPPAAPGPSTGCQPKRRGAAAPPLR